MLYILIYLTCIHIAVLVNTIVHVHLMVREPVWPCSLMTIFVFLSVVCMSYSVLSNYYLSWIGYLEIKQHF